MHAISHETHTTATSCSLVYVTVIYNTSIFLALYSLVLFYLSARVYLAPFKPLAKFALVKTIIFVTFWQNVLIAILFLVGVAKVGHLLCF